MSRLFYYNCAEFKQKSFIIMECKGMKNRNNIFNWVLVIGLIGSLLIISGCETEQSASKSNNAMVGYTQK